MAMERPTQGIEIIEGSLGPPSITTSNFSTIGVVGTAYNADPTGKFQAYDADDNPTGLVAYNHPFQLKRRSDVSSDDLGFSGTLPLALNSLFDQGATSIIMVIVDGGNAIEYKQNLEYKTAGNKTAAQALTPTNAGEVVWTTYTETSKTYLFFKDPDADFQRRLKNMEIGDTFTLVQNTGSVSPAVITEWDASESRIEVSNTLVPGNFTTATKHDVSIDAISEAEKQTRARSAAIGVPGDLTGVNALKKAQSEHGVTPRILVTPGIDNGAQVNSAANGLGGALKTLADDLSAITILDMPNDKSTAVNAAADFRDSDRTVLVSPAAKMTKHVDANTTKTVDFAMSGFVAGRIAATDVSQGFWTPIGNKPLNGVLGLAVPVDFQMDNPNSGVQDRINAGMITVVNQGGFRTWGDATPAAGAKAPYRFVNVRRIGDILAHTIQVNHLWAVSKAIGKNYLSEVAENVNAYIRILKAQGALRGGFCYPDGEKNTKESIANGQVYFNLEYTPVYPATSITFHIQLTTKYLAEAA